MSTETKPEAEHNAGVDAFRRLRKLCLLGEQKFNEKAMVKLLKQYAPLVKEGVLNIDMPYDLKTLRCLIHVAALHGCTKLLHNLIDLGADVNKQDGDGNTAFFHVVAKMDSEDTRASLKYLIENGADMNIANHKDQKPFDIASYRLEEYLHELEKEMNPKVAPNYDFDVENVKRVFKLIDIDGDGFFNVQKLRRIVAMPEINQGHDWSEDLVHSMFRMVDENGEGNVSQGELSKFFLDVVNKTPTLPVLPTNKELEEIHSKHIDLVWVPQKRNSKMASLNDVGKLVKKEKLTYVLLEKHYTMSFLNESGHTYTTFLNFAKAFNPGTDKRLQKIYYRVFNAFCEENAKLCNGRFLTICLAAVIPEVLAGQDFADPAVLNKQRAEFIFKLLDINEDGWLSIKILRLCLQVIAIFTRKMEEIEKEVELLIVASGARKFKERFPKEAFLDVCQRFPEVLFPKLDNLDKEEPKKKRRKKKKNK